MLYANLYQAGGKDWRGEWFATRDEADLSASLTHAKRIGRIAKPVEPITILAPIPAWRG